MEGRLTEQDVARTLGISIRQAYRLKAKYRHGGAKAIAHGNRGRKPVHTLADSLKQRVMSLYRDRYFGSNSTHFAELLAEHEDIRLSVSSVRRILLEGRLRPARLRRRPKAHRSRPRKPQAGMLWQIDASPFAWLEDRGPELTLHGIIDDATGEVIAAAFRPTETLEGYVAVMMEGLRRKGVPLALYSDQHSIFHPPKGKPTLEQELAGQPQALSTFGQAIADLGITHIEALSPQAKGRIERLWQTMQDRLVVELRLRNVCTMGGSQPGPAGVDRKAQPPVCRRAARSGTGLPTAARNPFGAHFYPTGTPENQRRADLLLERKMLHAKARPRCTALGSEDRRRSACRHGWASVAMGSGTRLALCGDAGR